MLKATRWTVCLALLLLAGCSTRLNPAAEHILVTANAEQVQGATLLGSTAWPCESWEPATMHNLHISAKNFTFACGGDIALINVASSKNIKATIEAYRKSTK